MIRKDFWVKPRPMEAMITPIMNRTREAAKFRVVIVINPTKNSIHPKIKNAAPKPSLGFAIY